MKNKFSYSSFFTDIKYPLKKVILIIRRLKFVESFWKWYMLTSGLDKIAFEFYQKSLKYSTFKHLKSLTQKNSCYYKTRTLLKVFITWAEFTRDSFHQKYLKKKSSFQAPPKPHLNSLLQKFKKRHSLKSKIFISWVNLTKSSIFLDKLCMTISIPFIRSAFFELTRYQKRVYSKIPQKYSIDVLSDYELSVKITILERKLAGLHQELLSEQIANRTLLSEKEQLYKLLA